MDYSRTPADIKATAIMHDRLRKLAAVEGLKPIAEKTVEAMKAKGYLKPITLWGQTFTYGGFSGVTGEELTFEEVATRIDAVMQHVAIVRTTCPKLTAEMDYLVEAING